MKKTFLVITLIFSASQMTSSASAQGKYVDYAFLAECAAIFAVKGGETQGKVSPEINERYYSAAETFYKEAVNGGGEGMADLYKQKANEFKNVSPGDRIGIEYKRALDKQCQAEAASRKIYFQ